MKFISHIAAASALLACPTAAFAGTGPWTLSEAAGKVTITDASGQRAGARGMVVPAGATVSTGPGGRAVMTRGPEFVTVSPDSRLRVAEAAQQTGLVQILQDWGNAIFRIDKQKNPHFAVKTPYLAAVVKGTTFSITVSQEGASMQVVEGAVEVSTGDGGARDLIRPGSVAVVAASDRYRLSVQGQETRVIDSPIRATAPTVDSPVATPNVEPPSEMFAAEAAADNIVVVAIQPKSTELGSITGGLIAGNAAFTMVSAALSPATNSAVAEPAGIQLAAVVAEPAIVPVESAQVVASTETTAPALETSVGTGSADQTQSVTAQRRVDSETEMASVLPNLPKDTTANVKVEKSDAIVTTGLGAQPESKAGDGAAVAGKDLAQATTKPVSDAAIDANKVAAAAATETTKVAADSAAAASELASAQSKAAEDTSKSAAAAAELATIAAAKAAEDVAKATTATTPVNTATTPVNTKEAAAAAEQAAKDAKEAAEQAAKLAKEAAEQAAKDAKAAAELAAKLAKEAEEQAARDVKAAAELAARDAKATQEAAEQAAKAAKEVAEQAAKAAHEAEEQAARDAKAAAELAAKDAKAAQEAAGQAAKAAKEAADQATRDAKAAAEQAARDAKEAADAAAKLAKEAIIPGI